jgi:hypothetical protein
MSDDQLSDQDQGCKYRTKHRTPVNQLTRAPIRFVQTADHGGTKSSLHFAEHLQPAQGVASFPIRHARIAVVINQSFGAPPKDC